MTKQNDKPVHISIQETYKPGDAEPKGYVEWQEWADAQRKAGLKQVQCGRCGLFKFPQQLSGKVCIKCLELAS